MSQIIPAVNAPDFPTAKKQFEIIQSFLSKDGWIHIDIADGKFTHHVTWNNPEELKELISNFSPSQRIIRAEGQFLISNIEVHLMVVNPEAVMESWLKAGAKRVIVHEEVITDPEFIKSKCFEYHAEAMIAVNPETSVEALKPYLNKFGYFQILAVKPGPAGQKFQPETVDKIKSLRTWADVIIEIDGGLTPEIIRECLAAGANFFVSASYILESSDPKRAYNELLTAAEDG